MMKTSLPTKTYKTGKVVIDWKSITEGFEIEVDEQTFIVVSNENVEKVSKTTDKPYKVRRIVISDVHGNELEVGTESFKKGSFVKRFNKLYPQVEEVVTVETEVIEDIPTVEDTVEEIPTDIPTVETGLIVLEKVFEEKRTDEDILDFNVLSQEEQTKRVNEMYRIIGERGLWDDFNRCAYEDKTITSELLQVMMETMYEVNKIDVDFDEIQKQLNEECASRRRRRGRYK